MSDGSKTKQTDKPAVVTQPSTEVKKTGFKKAGRGKQIAVIESQPK
jgi:hypothetical protein